MILILKNKHNLFTTLSIWNAALLSNPMHGRQEAGMYHSNMHISKFPLIPNSAKKILMNYELLKNSFLSSFSRSSPRFKKFYVFEWNSFIHKSLVGCLYNDWPGSTLCLFYVKYCCPCYGRRQCETGCGGFQRLQCPQSAGRLHTSGRNHEFEDQGDQAGRICL